MGQNMQQSKYFLKDFQAFLNVEKFVALLLSPC